MVVVVVVARFNEDIFILVWEVSVSLALITAAPLSAAAETPRAAGSSHARREIRPTPLFKRQSRSHPPSTQEFPSSLSCILSYSHLLSTLLYRILQLFRGLPENLL